MFVFRRAAALRSNEIESNFRPEFYAKTFITRKQYSRERVERVSIVWGDRRLRIYGKSAQSGESFRNARSLFISLRVCTREQLAA